MFSWIIKAFFTVFMLQGHMYLFVHYVCFYSNIFGFETKVMFEHQLYFFYRGLCLSWFLFSFLTVSWHVWCVFIQKVIPFHEITDVKRAKTAGIFSNAIEIFAGGKKVLLDMEYRSSSILFWHFLKLLLWKCSFTSKFYLSQHLNPIIIVAVFLCIIPFSRWSFEAHQWWMVTTW